MEFVQLKSLNDIEYCLRKFYKLIPNLQNRIDLKEYAVKLTTYADVFVLKDKNKLIGFAAIYINDNIKQAYRSIIGIQKAYQHKGYGQILMNFCIEKCRVTGMKSLRLEVDKDNKRALEFIKK